MNLSRRRVLSCLAGLAASPLIAPSYGAAADLPALRLVTSFGVGAGNDMLMRLVARHLARLVPEIRLTVENEPRGEGQIALKRLFDGPDEKEAIVLVNNAIFYPDFWGDQPLPFSFSDLVIAGNITSLPHVLVMTGKSGIGSIDELIHSKESFVVPTASTRAILYYDSLFLNAALGTRLRPIPGYSGGSRILAAVSGEAQAIIGNPRSLAEVLQIPGSKIVLRLNSVPLAEEYGVVPKLADIVTTDQGRKIASFMNDVSQMANLLAVSPKTSTAEMAAIRRIFRLVLDDRDFIAEAKKMGLSLDQTPFQVTADRVKAMVSAIDTDKAALSTAITCGLTRSEGGDTCP
jgi:tripartite-type tricarboxylate transporter receptor subunit TctC